MTEPTGTLHVHPLSDLAEEDPPTVALEPGTLPGQPMTAARAAALIAKEVG